MHGKYVIMDDILEDPHYLVNLAKTLSYNASSDNLIEHIKIKNKVSKVGWRGFRSENISVIDKKLYDKLCWEISIKLFSLTNCLIESPMLFLHYSPAFIGDPDQSWWHRDARTTVAGVIYLHQQPEINSGTLISLSNNTIQVENKFNRLVFYDATLLHRPERCYGTTIHNSRLTLTIFCNNIQRPGDGTGIRV